MTEPLSMDQVFIRKLTKIVLANLSDESFGAEKLAKAAGMSGHPYWYQPNYGATNESGFTSLPSCYRGSTSKFLDICATGEFWSFTSYSDEVGYGFWLDYWTTTGKYFDAEYVYKKAGFKVNKSLGRFRKVNFRLHFKPQPYPPKL